MVVLLGEITVSVSPMSVICIPFFSKSKLMASPALISPIPSPGCHDLLFVTDDMRLEGLPASCVDSPL